MDLGGLYAIADDGMLRARAVSVAGFAESLRAAGVRTVQWRAKGLAPHEVLAGAALLRKCLVGSGCRLVMNDRVDLALLAGFDGVHVGQEDLLPADARRAVQLLEQGIEAGAARGQEFLSVAAADFVIGVSTHTEAEVVAAEAGAADYVAIGPVFQTGSKADAAAVVGLDGVRRARALTPKPLVAIGGITRANAEAVRRAGADAVAVISGLLVPGETVEKVARDFLAIFG